ncbi:glutamine--fructose-6-phosphate transaminase (isomerizing) [Haloarchaeobius amylolyticus]|uniref:glutamine--fructose-6-phosphate transaminase (isomerizing) n=1 Tax=Haloarchaeobius amylolyticus TaxID=1198296 RepID=UPI00227050B0|nr:glutamine--fructose-6-phosphate transaminase (isomerizing) [Haloarchaeobius amylolyticus]
MCGIIACVGPRRTVDRLVTGLENLEYRGYDSAGVAIQNGSGVEVHKRSGRVGELKEEVPLGKQADVGIGHTRWSTHGPPTDENAHPHTPSDENVAVVHNGIIENYSELRDELEAKGHEFTSDTDTEVIPHLVDERLEETGDPEVAFRETVRELEGSYAIAAIMDGHDGLFAARQGSPLVVGLDDDAHYLASDVPAFLDYTDDVMYLEDGDVVVIEEDDLSLTDLSGTPVAREVQTVDWDPSETGKGVYDHYMLKEINHQPTALSNTIQGRADPESETVQLEDFPPETFEDVRDVHFVACGTSYHAAMFGAKMLRDGGISANAYRASEYGLQTDTIDDETLVVAVTQSGETADTLSAMRQAADKGASVVTVTNVVGSTAAREADESLFIRAGPEIGVAATKTFSSQVVSLALLSQRVLGDATTGEQRDDLADFLASLQQLPEHIEQVLDFSAAKRLAQHYSNHNAYFFIGRGVANAVAMEGALKFKEITYEHAEGFAAGELKHGPLALVTDRTPVFAVFTGDEDHDRKTLNNAKEAQTRGAPIVSVAPADHPSLEFADEHLQVPSSSPEWVGLLANVQLQLLSYYAAETLSRPIDKPRNLAKSVTVE